MLGPYAAQRSPTTGRPFATGRTAALGLVIAWGLGACAPPQDDPLPVVATGRYVEIATVRQDPTCGGTVAFIDAFLEAGFEAIGERPPDGVFVRYEWQEGEDDVFVDADASDEQLMVANAELKGGLVTISTARLPHEHELAHAVHLIAWPRAASFLHEGFAVLFDSRRGIYSEFHVPPLDSIDRMLGAQSAYELRYDHAWYIVGQIAYEHGVGGLKELWHAVPPGASAAQVRATYEGLFGSPIEALFEPWIYTGELSDGEPSEVPRYPCGFSLCPAPVRPYREDGLWSAAAPFSCEDDPDAVGPALGDPWFDPVPVWREYSMQRDPGPYNDNIGLVDGPTDPPRSVFTPCFVDCSRTFPRYEEPPPDYVPLGTHGRFRIQIGAELEDLPTDSPPQLLLR